MTRRFSAVLGLVAGLATLLAAAGPASAIHLRMFASGADADAVVTMPPGAPAIVNLGDPLLLFGELVDDAGGGSFTHRFSFGFDTSGPGGASAIPNVLTVDGAIQAGFQAFSATLTGPGIGTIDLTPVGTPGVPTETRLAASFAALDTSGPPATTPYVLTVMGTLLQGVTAGNYTGNIGVVPLPGAALLFLTALGGLAIVRRYRRREEEEPVAAAA